MAHLGIKSTEFPLDEAGRTMHMGVNQNQLANRIIVVGDYERCKRMSSFLKDPIRIKSKRKFLTYTGLYNNVPVSVTCGGMGISNTDFVVRESRGILPGPMCIVRFGTCGVVQESIHVGGIIVPESAIMVQQNFFGPPSAPFLISDACPADPALTKLTADCIKTAVGKEYEVTTGGIVGTADSFYASQGRKMDCFNQDNGSLFDDIKKKHPKHQIFEMEAYYILKLAEMSKPETKIYGATACIGLFNRVTKDIVPHYKVDVLEILGGKGIFDAVTQFKFPEKEPAHTKTLMGILGKK